MGVRRARGQPGKRVVCGALLCATFACQSYPTRPVVTSVRLSESEPRSDVQADDVLSGLATAESPKFLLLFRGVAVDYEIYDPNVLAKDLERIERYYRARGYYEAKVTAARVLHYDPERPKVRVEFRVDPGPQVKIRSIQPKGFARLPFDVSAEATRAVVLKVGMPFDEEKFQANKRDVQNVLADNGFAFAKVEGRARVDIAEHTADVEFEVIESGPRSKFGQIRIIGLEEIPEGKVRDNLGLEQGQQYSASEIHDAEKQLIELGVFSSVEIQEDKSHPESGTVPINVLVRESKLRTVRLGGGSRLDVLRASTHVRLGWEDRNFLGGMRRLTIDAKPGFTWYPISLSRFSWPPKPLFEHTISTELRQPSFVEGRTTGFISGEYKLFPLLYPLPEKTNPETERIIGFHSIRASTGVERAFFGHHLYIRPSYNWQANFPLVYQDQPGFDEGVLVPVRVSFPELVTTLDFRDDPVSPRRGFFVTNSLQTAGGIFLGTVSDVRVQPEARAYRDLSKRFTLATRLTFGFLFPRDYGNSLNPETKQGGTAAFDPTDPTVIEDQQKLLFRAFYSGGPSSNRGYPFRSVGPHGPIGFLVPTGANCALERIDPATGERVKVDPDTLSGACFRPLGGVTLWEASLEVRALVTGPLYITAFVDASDLTREVGLIRLNVPHVSPGLGLRYMTAVGPLRLDVGYRVPGLQKLGADKLPKEEGQVSDLFGVLPIAVHVAIGEAF